MALIVVEAVLADNKPPVVDDSMRTSTGGRCGFGASASLLIKASSMHFSGANKRGSAIIPKLVKLIGPLSTLAEELSPFFARKLERPSYVCESFRLFLHLPPWRDVAAELHAAVLLNADFSFSFSQ